MQWDPNRYLAYGDERSRPFFDLVARIGADAPAAVVDLGCGPGGLTRTLADRWPQARVTGVDSSEQMIASARVAGVDDRVELVQADVRSWQPAGPVDVVVSNATLQWVPDHLPLLRRWVDWLPPGGWLAMQVPANFDAPSHRLMRELAGSARWRGQLGDVLRHPDAVSEPAEYLDLLAGAGCAVDVWQTTYLHVLAGEDAVLEWVRGTGLRPVLAALTPAEAAEFEAEYGADLRAAYPRTAYGTVFPFTRTFAVARKESSR